MGINFYENNGFDHDADMLLIIMTIVKDTTKNRNIQEHPVTQWDTQKKKLAEYKLST